MAPITYLMGTDAQTTGNPFFALAKTYFQQKNPDGTIVDAPAAVQTLEGVFKHLNSLGKLQTRINLVSHASGFGALNGAVTDDLRAKGQIFIEIDDLKTALANKVPTPLGPAIVSPKTCVVIYGCDVGRSAEFLTLLSGLFGNPGELLAPRRMAVFVPDPGGVKYRQARTWTLTRPKLLPTGTSDTVWKPVRDQFVADASMKFGRFVGNTGDMLAQDHLTAMITAAALHATTKLGPTFFLEETVPILPAPGQTAEEAAQSINTATNGDPVTPPSSLDQVDDSTVVTTIGPADTSPVDAQKTAFRINIVILGQILDREVVLTQPPDYQSCCSSKGLAPSPGPKAASAGDGGTGGSVDGDPLQTATQLLLAGGVSQTDIDALLASVPTGDATEDIDTDAPAAVPVDGDTVMDMPPEEFA